MRINFYSRILRMLFSCMTNAVIAYNEYCYYVWQMLLLRMKGCIFVYLLNHIHLPTTLF